MVFSGEMFVLAIPKISNLTENQSALREPGKNISRQRKG
jgi:hypothetical protein